MDFLAEGSRVVIRAKWSRGSCFKTGKVQRVDKLIASCFFLATFRKAF